MTTHNLASHSCGSSSAAWIGLPPYLVPWQGREGLMSSGTHKHSVLLERVQCAPVLPEEGISPFSGGGLPTAVFETRSRARALLTRGTSLFSGGGRVQRLSLELENVLHCCQGGASRCPPNRRRQEAVVWISSHAPRPLQGVTSASYSGHDQMTAP